MVTMDDVLTRALFDALSSVHVLAVRVIPRRVRDAAVDLQWRTQGDTPTLVDETLARLHATASSVTTTINRNHLLPTICCPSASSRAKNKINAKPDCDLLARV